MVEKFRKAVTDQEHSMPLARLMGYTLVSVEAGEATIEMETGGQHANPMGTLHGGVLCTIADSAMGIAHQSTLNDDESSTTLELKINFLRPVWSDRLRALGKIVKSGKTISLVECEVTDSSGRLVAKASSTYMTLRGDQAAGREVQTNRE